MVESKKKGASTGLSRRIEGLSPLFFLVQGFMSFEGIGPFFLRVRVRDAKSSGFLSCFTWIVGEKESLYI